MSAPRIISRAFRPASTASRVAFRPLSTTAPRYVDHSDRKHPTDPAHRKNQTEKPLNPHMTNTNSTIANEMPSVGADKAPPEFLSSVDPDFVPKDSKPENTKRMTGGTQESFTGEQESFTGEQGELAVGELEGAEFKIEPLRREGEDASTMRARLLCPFTIPFSSVYFLDLDR